LREITHFYPHNVSDDICKIPPMAPRAGIV
jgi:hypothetical protein